MILPIATPVIESYLHHAYQTAIIGCHEKTTPWILSNYIQLYYDGNILFPIQFYMPDSTGYTWNFLCPWMNYQVIHKKTLIALKADILDLIIHAINDGYYVIAYVNEKYIPNKPSYQSKDFSHMFMIYGYDLDKKTFWHLGYNNRIFGSAEVVFNEFIKAFHDNPQYQFYTHDRLYLLKVNENFKYDFNIEFIRYQLIELVSGKHRIGFQRDPNHIFGYDVYDNLITIIKDTIQEGFQINIIPFLLLSEHKKLMNMRLEYLGQMKDLDVSFFMQGFSQVAERFITLRNKAMKYNFSGNYKSIQNLEDEILSLKEEELKLVNLIINRL